jgi:hypothetical protein
MQEMVDGTIVDVILPGGMSLELDEP